jgi:hypothetical protein
MQNLFRARFAISLLSASLIVTLSAVEAFAQSGSAGGSIGNDEKSLSGARRVEPEQPARRSKPERAARQSPQRGSGGANFDGAWIFTASGCSTKGTMSGAISGGRLSLEGVRTGQVTPSGSLYSAGSANGLTTTASGRLSGVTGSGTFRRSDGCGGRWTALKQ